MHNLHVRLHINDVNVAVLTAGSHDYDDDKKQINNSIYDKIYQTHRFEENI